MYSDIEDPCDMTPEQRFREIAFLLAKGYIRLKIKEKSSGGGLSGGSFDDSSGGSLSTTAISKSCAISNNNANSISNSKNAEKVRKTA